MNKKKGLLIFITVVLIGGGAWGFWSLTHKEDANEKQKIKIETATAQLGDISETVTGSGNLAAKYKKTLTASEPATIDEISVEAGDKVDKGDTLVTFTNGQDAITAPFTGEITTVPVAEGDTVNAGTEIVGVTNFNKLVMNVDIDELDIASVKKGQKATITVSALSDKKITGKVTKVAKEANEDATSSVAKYAVQLTLDSTSGAKPGMTAEATIHTKTKDNVLTVPVEALQKGQDGYYVLVTDGTDTDTSQQDDATSGGTKQQVEVGLQTTETAEIVSGLSEGDQILIPMFESDEKSTDKMPEMGPGGDMPQGGKGGPGQGMPQGGTNGGMAPQGDRGGQN